LWQGTREEEFNIVVLWVKGVSSLRIVWFSLTFVVSKQPIRLQ
jgi:hypothetical protein